MNWRLYLPMAASLLAITFTARWFMTPGEQRGFFTGAMVTLSISVVLYMASTLSGAHQMSNGGEAERFTTQELRKLDAGRWVVFDHVEFADFDVDHVVVGPGVVYAVETKWRLSPPERRYLSQFCRQSRRAADRLELLLRSKGVRRKVRPVVVLWGPGHRDHLPPGGETVDGVLVVGGGHHQSWRPVLAAAATGFELDHPAIRAIEEYVIRHDAHLAVTDSRSRWRLRGARASG